MKQASLKEASAILRQMLALINAAPTDRMTKAAADLRHAVGELSSGAETAISGFTFAGALVDIFALVRSAGASFASIDAIRQQATALVPVTALAGILADAVVLQALACECRIIADLVFQSRDQVDAYRNTLDAAFDAAIDKAADDYDQTTVQALISLRAAVMRDLSARARPLPEIVNYSFPIRRAALWISERLYGDGSRYSELIAENSAVHPLFMPAIGRALSR